MGGMLHHPSFFLLLPYLDDPNNLSLVKGFIGGVVWGLCVYVCVPPLPTPVLFLHYGPKFFQIVLEFSISRYSMGEKYFSKREICMNCMLGLIMCTV